MTQWATQVPEWYIGASNAAIAPSTNNGAESCVKNTRIDAGNVVASIGEVVAFLLSQVEAVSSNKFDASAVRVTPRAIWHRAAAFSSHIGTQLVRKVDQDGQPWYVCSPRKDPTGEDVGNRKVLSMAAQQVLSKPFVRSAEASALKLPGPSFVSGCLFLFRVQKLKAVSLQAGPPRPSSLHSSLAPRLSGVWYPESGRILHLSCLLPSSTVLSHFGARSLFGQNEAARGAGHHSRRNGSEGQQTQGSGSLRRASPQRC